MEVVPVLDRAYFQGSHSKGTTVFCPKEHSQGWGTFFFGTVASPQDALEALLNDEDNNARSQR